MSSDFFSSHSIIGALPSFASNDTRMTCEVDGKSYGENEEWTTSNFRYKCMKNGVYDIIGMCRFYLNKDEK
jgi:hypothetical protein